MKKTNRMDINKAESLIEREFEWRKWTKEIPSIPMNSNWVLAPIPPFGGAVARMLVKHKENTKAKVSVYLDCYENLGCWDGPYWEIYPNQEDDVSRFDMQDVGKLSQAIEASLQAQIKELNNKG